MRRFTTTRERRRRPGWMGVPLGAALALLIAMLPAHASVDPVGTDADGAPARPMLQPAAPGHWVLRGSPSGLVTAGTSNDFVFDAPAHATIADLNVALDLETATVSQAIVTLEHGGISVALLDEPDCSGADADVVFDDEAGLDAEDVCSVLPPALRGTIAPVAPLSVFDGHDVRGEWTLSVEALGVDVRVYGWELHVAVASADTAVALIPADSGQNVRDVSDKLWATNRFDVIWYHRTGVGEPLPGELARYDAVLVWSNVSFSRPDVLGDRLADYIDAGGGVVLGFPTQTSAGLSIEGRFVTDQYGTFTADSFTTVDPVSGIDGVLPNHPILAGATTVAGTSHSVNPVLLPGAELVANWDGTSLPLVATRSFAFPAGRVASLDFWPPSSDVTGIGWDATTDGDILMANALDWVMESVTCNGLPATIVGTEGDDALVGTPGPDVIAGLGGKDTIRGRNGDDVICGGTGSDWIDPGGGNDWVHGQAGNDTISYATAGSAVNVNLAADTATGGSGNDTLLSIEFANGSKFDDILTGDGAANVLRGIGGADTIDGKGGSDTILAGAGSDVLIGGPGDDKLNGGSGADEITYATSPNGVVVDLLAQTATGHGDDTPKSIERITGSPFADTLSGNGFRNIINGGAGNDIIKGRGANDVLNGGAGFDTINGGAGTDSCTGETVIACE